MIIEEKAITATGRYMTLKNKTIVFLGNTRFDSAIKATSLFIARNLAKENKVLFVDYPFTLKDYLNYSQCDGSKERKEKFSPFSDGLMDTDLPNLKIVITPPVLPINFLPEGPLFRSLLKVNEYVISERLKKIFKSQGIKDFIYINSFNFHYPNIAKMIKPALTVYHCVDPMIVPYDMKHGIKSENELVRNSDLVICTSKALYEEKKQLNSQTYFVPNATDSEHAPKTLASAMAVHPKLKNFKGPIVGYLGTVERRIDYDLVEQVVKMNPDKTFIFAGPVSDNFVPSSLTARSNVHFLGAVPYPEVPQMINSFDVAIIPFKKDKVSETIFPIKLFEYLSAGKPVIVSDFNPDLKDFTGDVVTYCKDSITFSEALCDALENDNILLADKRRELAANNTWENRSEQIAGIISDHLK